MLYSWIRIQFIVSLHSYFFFNSRLKESGAINTSLFVLGEVVAALNINKVSFLCLILIGFSFAKLGWNRVEIASRVQITSSNAFFKICMVQSQIVMGNNYASKFFGLGIGIWIRGVKLDNLRQSFCLNGISNFFVKFESLYFPAEPNSIQRQQAHQTPAG